MGGDDEKSEKRFHSYRTLSRYCNYRYFSGDFVPGVCPGAQQGASNDVSIQHASDGVRYDYVPERL
jgi:hypothetical protein